MKNIICLLFLVIPFLASSQAGSEIYLFDLQLSKNKVLVSNPINVTNHPGYDNQPSFHDTKPLLYYSSFDEDGRSDIKIYNYQTGETKALTTTSEREYSPTLTPDGQHISCIVQRDSDAQDLGQYPADGGEAITLIDNLIVGYHAWVDEYNLLLFILGDPMTLQWYDLNNKTSTVVEENIGRSLHKIPNQNAMSFVKKKSESEWVINRLDIATKEIAVIATTLPGKEDFAWADDGRIIMSDGMKLFFYDVNGKKEWKEIEMSVANTELRGVTRLAITKDGRKLAVVASE